MRHKWEFEDVYGFIQDTFAQYSLDDLRGIRYFDPTQSFSDNRIDKGLVEGLTLNRAALTVYLAQETDTLGKDSELAATLAQGKPVIAYVPPIDEKYEQKLPNQPLDFFLKRLYLLQADDAFKKPKCYDDMREKFGDDGLTRLGDYVDCLSKYIADRTFYLVGNEDNEFKSDNSEMFTELCQMLTVAERHYFDGRAYTLQKVHPLAVQVNLRNGVANGVLVVRSAKVCADLIRQILSNSMDFEIANEEHVAELREKQSKCPFRVVTDDQTLTNSFWNFYLTERRRRRKS